MQNKTLSKHLSSVDFIMEQTYIDKTCYGYKSKKEKVIVMIIAGPKILKCVYGGDVIWV